MWEPLPRRDIELDPASPVCVTAEAARRILQASRGTRDPLGIRSEAPGGDTREERTATLACAALQGRLPIAPEHVRTDIHPVTQAMLLMAGIDADAFAALAALGAGGGLYIDDPDGRTLAKAISDPMSMEPDLHPYIRVRVPALRARPRITCWQERDRSIGIAVPPLPATIGVALTGRPLSRLMDDPAPGEHRLVVVDVIAGEDDDEPRSIVRLRDADNPD